MLWRLLIIRADIYYIWYSIVALYMAILGNIVVICSIIRILLYHAYMKESYNY
jgi:hypothetical protein